MIKQLTRKAEILMDNALCSYLRKCQKAKLPAVIGFVSGLRMAVIPLYCGLVTIIGEEAANRVLADAIEDAKLLSVKTKEESN